MVYLLDERLKLVPPGIPGEIHIGGACLARGYVNQPELSAKAFVPDVFSSAPDARLYRTGDLARFLPDGSLEYLGSVDEQVKIRGYRIEPREIQAVLLEHEAVKDAVVVVWEEEGDKRLVAYVVPHKDLEANTAEFRAFLKAKMPAYMVPAAFVVLPLLPLNVNGKVDRGALPRPDFNRANSLPEQLQLPGTPTEEKISDIWKSVLKLDIVGTDEDFFALGGHSLLATQVVAQVSKTMGVDLPLIRLFEAPTIAELARVVDDLVGGGTGDVPHIDEAALAEVADK
jgi:acyl carrier protein